MIPKPTIAVADPMPVSAARNIRGAITVTALSIAAIFAFVCVLTLAILHVSVATSAVSLPDAGTTAKCDRQTCFRLERLSRI